MGEAARVGDSIGHSHALAGMIGGTLIGGLIAAAGARFMNNRCAMQGNTRITRAGGTIISSGTTSRKWGVSPPRTR